jgi:hypothetical protein
MTWDEYNKQFHKLQLNRVAFKRLIECDKEVLELVNAAIAAERKRICDMLLDMHAKEERHNYYGFIANIIKESA